MTDKHQQPKEWPNSTELIAMAHTEWNNREKRRGIHNEQDFCAGWISGYLSRPHPAPAHCPHWKDASNLKSDFRDQITGDYYCDLPTPEQAARKAREEFVEDYTRELKERIIKSNIPSNCFDRLSMIIHDTVESLRQPTEQEQPR